MIRSAFRPALLAACALLPAACAKPGIRPLDPLPPVVGNGGVAPPRVDGVVGTPTATPAAQFSYGSTARAAGSGATSPGATTSGAGGDISFDFADTDIREVAAQILGRVLQVNYTIDPAVHGTATLRTTQPLARDQLIPTLEALLSQNGATLVRAGDLYRIVPASAASTPILADGGDTAGTQVIPLHYASADNLAKVLQPYVGTSGRIIADPARNAVLIAGSPAVRAALLGLIGAFDIDVLAGQSYALLPVTSGDAKDFASALQDAFRAQSGGALNGLVRVVPMERVNAVLLVASQPRYVDDARRVYALIERMRRDTIRSWHVLYLQTGRADDVAFVLQQAFTPNNVTAQPTANAPGAQPGGMQTQQISGTTGFSGMGGSTPGGGTSGGGASGGGSTGGLGSGIGGGGSQSAAGGGGSPTSPGGTSTGSSQGGQLGLAAGNPLLGPLSPTTGGNSGDNNNPNSIRIIPDRQTNAILSYATPREEDTIEAMLRKIDILPLQVRIDATIAEVSLNDTLQYGTQFYFKSGGINGVLSTVTQSLANTPTTLSTLNAGFPGFVLAGANNGGAPFAITALQAVTKVQVLSSPELMVLDGQPARLQVGDLVPYLTQTSQSTLVSGSPVVNSVNYQATGVIMQVTPRVNKGGLVTMDIAQEVSDVDTTAPQTQGLNSPTFNERSVTSRVVIQDGQTVGLAGLIRDNVSRGNQGIPYLKDIPLLGLLAGSQNNTRQRTELLVLITPHVIHDQRDARALTDDLREQLINAASAPGDLQRMPTSGAYDPSAPLRHALGAPN